MATQKAIVINGNGWGELVTDRPVPASRPLYSRVEVKAVALNPTDWKSMARMKKTGHLSGCDYAGVVEEPAADSEKKFKAGERIAGFVHGGNAAQAEDGAFAEHILVKTDVQLRIPDNISFEDAATLPVGVFTCGQGLYQTLKLNSPLQPADGKEAVLIFAGSTATGALGVQFAKLSGYKVISTCSSRNFDYVKSLGADGVFDYKDPDCAKKIVDFAGGKIERIWDTISLESSAKICADVIADGGHYAAILNTKCPKPGVKNSATMGYTIIGEPIDKGWFKNDDTTEDFKFAKGFALTVEKLLAEGKLRPHKTRVSKQGLDGVLEGLEQLKDDKVSGEKLVYVL